MGQVAPDSPLKGKVVVVTGASAGVGRATALEAGRRGARVGLIARSHSALEAIAREIGAAGSRAVVYALDVEDAKAVAAAADRIASDLGAIDIWINAAMLTVFSPIQLLKADEVRRVTAVTYLGVVNGTLAALAHMRPRGRGMIVQVGSALAYRGIPLQAAYCAAKHAVRGFTASLRAELIHQDSAIRVVEVHLPGMNTPQFSWARTHLPVNPRPVPPVYAPHVAANAILDAATRGPRVSWLSLTTGKVVLGQALAPALMDQLMAHKAWETQFTGAPAVPREGNLYASMENLHATEGQFSAEAKHRAVLVSDGKARIGVVVAGAALAALIGFIIGAIAF